MLGVCAWFVVDVRVCRWDTMGTEQYGGLSPAFLRGANGVVLVYDTTSKETLERLEESVREMLKHNDSSSVSVCILGNKGDVEDRRDVTDADVQAFIDDLCTKHRLRRMEHHVVSALTGQGVAPALDAIVKQCVEREAEQSGAGQESDFVIEDLRGLQNSRQGSVNLEAGAKDANGQANQGASGASGCC